MSVTGSALVTTPFPPLKVNPQTGELYLQLPSPHTNIVITPPRPDDGPLVTEVLGDYAVNKHLGFPPWPFQPSASETWLASVSEQCEPIVNAIKKFACDSQTQALLKPYFDGPPVAMLREVKDNGPDTFLGAIRIRRTAKFQYLRDLQKDQECREENQVREVGDPRIIWEIAYYMRSSHQGRGITSSAVGTLIHGWARPYMNAQHIHGVVFSGNEGSLRVFQKNGFRQFDFVDDCVEIEASKGGGRVGLHFFELKENDEC